MPDDIGAQLESVAVCPACESGDASLIPGEVYRNRYGKILDRRGIPLARMRVLRCGQCGSAWRDPWPSADVFHHVYSEAEPCHPAGSMTHQESGVLRRGPARLHDFFTRHVSPFDSYAEFGCPAWGLLGYYGTRRFRFLFGALDVDAGATMGPATAGQIADHPSRAVRLLRRAVGLTPVQRPRRLVALRADPRLFWGAHCRLNGVSCFDAARVRANVELPSPAELAANPVDILTMILVLDHYHRPAELLAACATWARHIFIFTHSASDYDSRAPQHLINFSAEGLTRLAKRAGLERVADYLWRGDSDDFGILFRSPRL